MQISESIKNEVAILTLRGNFLCEPDRLKLRERLKSLVDKNTSQVVVDLHEVTCIDSMGLGTLIAAYTTLRRVGGDLKLAHVSDMVDQLLNMTKLVNVFESYETVERAAASYKTGKK